ncbi:MAG: WD40 repeat domain-containing protein [Microcystaceae cyanobacterium]
MITKLLQVQLSHHYLSFQPGKEPVHFEVSVTNLSQQFASFQLKLQAAGTEQINVRDWYRLEPDISSKTPSGGTVKFTVTIQKNPYPGFVGEMDISVRLFSVELPNSEHRELLHLTLEKGIEKSSLSLKLPIKRFHSYSGAPLNIPVQIAQHGLSTIPLKMTLIGLNPAWFPDQLTRKFSLRGQSTQEIIFSGELPASNEVISQLYPFTIKVEPDKGQTIETEGILDVLPFGQIKFELEAISDKIPNKRTWLPHFRVFPATYRLKFTNNSNLIQVMSATLQKSEIFPAKWQLINPQSPFISFFIFQLFITLWNIDPLTATLFFREYSSIRIHPNESGELDLKIQAIRPWFARVKRLIFPVAALPISDVDHKTKKVIEIENDLQSVKLAVYPKIPLWLGGIVGLFLLWFWWSLSCLNPTSPRCGHRLAINSVQFNGRGLSAISGSDDQTIIEWNLQGFGLKKLLNDPIFKPTIATGKQKSSQNDASSKAIRVVRYKPLDNNIIAAGLENGEIQLWNLLGNRQCPQAIFRKDLGNRVLDLAFSADSQFLYGSYGSGAIHQWKYPLLSQNTENCPPPITTPLKEQTFGFAISSLMLVGEDQNLLALGGQYNRFCLTSIDLTSNQCASIGKLDGNDQDYLETITVASAKPSLLATANNQGKIKLWNLNQDDCLNNLEKCQDIQPIDQWSENLENPERIDAIALSEKGCYLVSGGEKGEVLLWILNSKGVRAYSDPIKITQSPKAINSVDIKVIDQEIHVLSGGDQTKVRLNTVSQKRLPVLGCQ